MSKIKFIGKKLIAPVAQWSSVNLKHIIYSFVTLEIEPKDKIAIDNKRLHIDDIHVSRFVSIIQCIFNFSYRHIDMNAFYNETKFMVVRYNDVNVALQYISAASLT